MLQERLSEMILCPELDSSLNNVRYDNLSAHFPQYSELDHLFEADDDIHILPTF